MIQLIYTSTVAPQLESGEIFRIVSTSATNNARDGLSGFLLYFNEQFFQVVEGPETAIDGLMRRLETDPRHHSIRIVERREIPSPNFPTWRMKRLFAAPETSAPGQIDPSLATAPANVRVALSEFLSSHSTNVKAA